MNSSFIGLVNNAALLLALGLLYDVLQLRHRGEKSVFQQISTGLILGSIGIAIMLNPWDFGHGVVFDTRSVLLCISGFFFGTIPLLLAVLVTSVFRLSIGGAGAWTGVAVIVTSGGIGLVWRHLHRDRKEDPTTGELYLLGIVVHISMLAWMFSLPWQVALGVLSKITLPIILIHPLATALLGKLMVNRGKRKRSEEALRKSDEDLKESQRIAHVGSWHLDVSSNQVVWSEELYRMYGFDPQLSPPPYTEHQKLFTPESWDRLSAALNNTKDNGIPYELELETVREDGSCGWMWVHGMAVLDTRGVTIGLRGAAQDITERKRAEEALRETEKRFRDLADLLPEAIFETDANMNLTYINKQAIFLFGYSREDFEKGLNALEMLIPEDRKIAQINVLKRLQGEDVGANEYLGLRKDGSMFPILLHTNAIIHQKNVLGLRGIIIDLTDRKRMEARLQQAQKMESIGNLSGGIAHDFNNLLSSIIGFTELSLDEVEKGTPLEDNLQEVYTAGKRARDLVKQILAFARQSDEERKPIRVDIIAKEVIKLLRSTIPKTIEIKENIESHSLIMGNPTQVHQILMNLCANAAQAMEDTGGILEIGLADVELNAQSALPLSELNSGNYMKATVSDIGLGISPNIIGLIFEPYFTTKDAGEGTGMGLALVHGIVESYGGKIIVDSELGKGSVFSIYLPITKKRGDYRPYKEEKLPSGTERILFVDDEFPIAKMNSQILERLGYRVTVCTSSVEALELFRSKPDGFDLIVTDMTMPNMAGDYLAAELMKIRSDIPVILCTGYSKKISDKTASEIGIKAFVYKPVVRVDMAKTIRKVLDEAKG